MSECKGPWAKRSAQQRKLLSLMDCIGKQPSEYTEAWAGARLRLLTSVPFHNTCQERTLLKLKALKTLPKVTITHLLVIFRRNWVRNFLMCFPNPLTLKSVASLS